MSYNISGPIVSAPPVKIANASATKIYTAISRTTIVSIICTENSGSGTPTLTIEKYDGTHSYYFRKAVAMTAGTAFIFNEAFVLDAGWSIRVTSGDASGLIDAHVNFMAPSGFQAKGGGHA